MLEKIPVNNIDLFDRAFKIIESSFPFDEFRPYKKQREQFEDEKCGFFILRDEAALPAAIIVIWEFEKFVFVENFAVSGERRNDGLGSKILQEVISTYAPKRVCLEVEPPETEIAIHRVGFYERNGLSFNEYPYIMPALAQDRKALPLFLMTTGGKLTRDEFNEYKKIIYKNVYEKDED